MKKIILKIFVLALFIYSCENKEPTEPDYDPDAVRVAGKYIATTFILPGSNDASIDVLANGGSITIELSLVFTCKGRIVIPKHPNLNTEGIDQTFEGNYVVENDSVQFGNTNNILSHPQLNFLLKEKKLEGQLLSISPTTLILEKQN